MELGDSHLQEQMERGYIVGINMCHEEFSHPWIIHMHIWLLGLGIRHGVLGLGFWVWGMRCWCWCVGVSGRANWL